MKKSVLKGATTGLAGAMAIAGGSEAYGAVVQVTPPATITGTGTSGEATETYDINGDGTPDFIFGAGAANIGGSKYLAYTGITAYSGGTVGYLVDGAYDYASKLAKGTTVGASSYFVQGTYLTNISIKYGTTTAGMFKSGVAGYLGFSFTEADGTHYGYITVTSTLASTASGATSSGKLTFGKAYYDNVAGEAITIGGAVPEPSTLGALAFGLAGTVGAALYRRKRAAAPVA